MLLKILYKKNKSLAFLLFFLAFIFQTLLVCQNPASPSPPFLSIALQPQDTIFRINESVTVTANVLGDFYSRMRYVWIVDNGIPDTVKDFRREYKWGVADTGLHQISVFAIADDRIRSELNTTSIRVKCSYPEIDAQQRDTTVLWGDTLHINPKVHDSDGKIVSIKWKTDVDSLWYSTKPVGRNFVWNKLQTGNRWICVVAEDDDGLHSKPDTVNIKVNASSLKIKISRPDSVIQLFHSMTLRSFSQGIFPSKYFYQWTIDGILSGSNSDTLGIVFKQNETGQHTISVQVLYKDSSVICADTTRINAIYTRVNAETILSDSLLFANIALSVTPVLKKGTVEDIEKMWFVLDGIKKLPVIKNENNILIFGVADSGIHTIVLNVLDKDSVLSSSDTCKVTVLPGVPLLKLPFRDTTISTNDTIEIIPAMTDINGKIIVKEWYSQQTKKRLQSDQISVSYSGFPFEKINLAVCDNDSLWVYDTITVHFDSPPVISPIQLPPDTIFCTEQQPFADLLFSWSKFDREHDSVSMLLEIKRADTDSVWRFDCQIDSAYMKFSGVGEYHWSLSIKDSFGNNSAINGQFAVVQTHTICFAGHSIICGMAGDGLNGGFRSTVLNGLRENLSPYHKIKAHGPITTPDMAKYPDDDSCYAISGAKAYEMALFLRSAYKKLTADIWVVMLGANAGYTSTELKYTIEMVDTMLARNPNARVYMLTSPPFPADNYNFIAANEELITFNNAIYDSVTVRRTNKFNISVVSVDTLLTDSNHAFDPTWFADHVHPNMTGYYRVGNKVLEVMRSKKSPAIKEAYYLKEE